MGLPPMIPPARAVADRLIWEGAILRFLAGILPPGAAERHIPGPGWNVQQLYAHLARQEQAHADRLEGFLGGQPVAPSKEEYELWQAETVRLGLEYDLDHWLDAIELQRGRLYALLAQVEEARWAGPYDSTRSVADVVQRWSGHYTEHAFDLVEVVPEVTLEPILVRWLLRLDLSGNPALQERQRAYARRAREALAAVEAEAPGDV